MKVICVFLIHVFEKEIGITDNWHKKNRRHLTIPTIEYVISIT